MLSVETYQEYRKDSEVFDIAYEKTLTEEDFIDDGTYFISASNGRSMKKTEVNPLCYLAIVDRLLKKEGMDVFYSWSEELQSLFMEKIPSLDQILRERYGDELAEKTGILMFLDGREPGEGEESLLEVFPEKGQSVLLAHVVQKEK